MRRCVRGAVTAAALALLGSCAWTARENRPVWNAFEQHVVPGSDAAFYVLLPVSAPLGLAAILVDTFVAHPIQVVDEAWDDTCQLWRQLEFDERYYTESALLPVRTVATPVWFVSSFLGRSMFDIPSPEQQAERRQEAERWRRQRALAWCARIAEREPEPGHTTLAVEVDDELRAAFRRALEQGTAAGRLALYAAAGEAPDPGLVDWNRALQDPSAVVRYQVLDHLPPSFVPSAEVRGRLLADPDEAVRDKARRWFEG